MAYGTFGQDRKKDNELIRAYRNTFTSGDGRKVFAHMLIELGVFDQEPESEERRDYGCRLLMFLGICNGDNIENVVNALLDIPVILKDEEDANN